MRGNGAMETHVGKVQGFNSLSVPAARDPNPLIEVCCYGPVTTSEDCNVWAKSDLRFANPSITMNYNICIYSRLNPRLIDF